MEKAYLILENGMVFEGERFGAAKAEAVGELVFTTGVCGFLETLTDPSYYGQIVVQTFPMVGNYGVVEQECVSDDCSLCAYVVSEWCDTPSNFRCTCDLDGFLKSKGVMGICGVDTRRLTSVLRDCGSMRAMLKLSPPDRSDASRLKAFCITEGIKNNSCKQEYTVSPHSPTGKKAAVLDLGSGKKLALSLSKRGYEVTVLPFDTDKERISEGGFEFVALSEGAGDPKKEWEFVCSVKELFGKIPMFGVGLGHQLLAIAAGGSTKKLSHGHRGTNQPVVDVRTERVFITAQNHGYAVDNAGSGEILYQNLHDGTVEGLLFREEKGISVQFDPESMGNEIFDRFEKILREGDC